MNSKLSGLSIAAIALLVSAAPSFAQTGTVERSEMASLASTSEPAVAMARNLSATPLPSANASDSASPATKVAKVTLTPAMFLEPKSLSSTVEKSSVSSQKLGDQVLSQSGKEFGLNESSFRSTQKTSSVTFVPSSGPKVPWQGNQ